MFNKTTLRYGGHSGGKVKQLYTVFTISSEGQDY